MAKGRKWWLQKVILTLSHFHFHTFTFTLSLSHFPKWQIWNGKGMKVVITKSNSDPTARIAPHPAIGTARSLFSIFKKYSSGKYTFKKYTFGKYNFQNIFVKTTHLKCTFVNVPWIGSKWIIWAYVKLDQKGMASSLCQKNWILTFPFGGHL